jgi:uracil-DNA glycosylase
MVVKGPFSVSRNAYLGAMGIQTWTRRAGVPVEETPMVADSPPLAATEAPEAPATAPAAADATAGPPMPVGGGGVADLGWPELRARVVACTDCPLHATRTQAVFGVGNPQAELMIVGEAPGADEDRLGEPFVGRAGQLLTAMLRAIGLRREQVYIANILKCRPPGNRDPQPEEVLCCEPFLLRQIALVRPRVILAAGRVAAQNLLKSSENVGRLRAGEHRLGETPLLVTYHPAYLLRSPEEKGKAWQDLQRSG